jgi:DnaJ-class molecular chaperone
VVRFVRLGFPALDTRCQKCDGYGVGKDAEECPHCEGNGAIPTPEGIRILKLVCEQLGISGMDPSWEIDEDGKYGL